MAFSSREASFFPALSRSYRLFENVTVLSDSNPMEKQQCTSRGFEDLYAQPQVMTDSISIPLGLEVQFSIQEPSLDRWDVAKYYVVYNTP